jgi:hypothetical protein
LPIAIIGSCRSVHGAVSEIQGGRDGPAFAKSPKCGDSPLRLRLIEGNNVTSQSVDQFIQEWQGRLSGTRLKDHSCFQ